MDHQHGTTNIPTSALMATTVSSQPRIAVVGGSLTGPTVALLFLHAGFDNVTLFEAVSASAPQGGGLIGLEHSSLDILDRLGIGQPEFVTNDSETLMHITVCQRHPQQIRRHVYAGRNTARGANNGIEQAAGLVAALTQHRKYRADLPAALDGWQHRHLPAAVAAVHQGPALGRQYGLGPTD